MAANESQGETESERVSKREHSIESEPEVSEKRKMAAASSYFIIDF